MPPIVRDGPSLRGSAASLVLCLVSIASFAQRQRASAGLHPESPVPSQPVTVTDDGKSFILSNGYLTATINKKTGDMTSLRVYEMETQGYVSGHHAGYWEQNPNGAARMEAKVTIDPKQTAASAPRSPSRDGRMARV